jgi:hypothetical protein
LNEPQSIIRKKILVLIILFCHFRHPPRLQEIIEATQANSYHGFLPALVRQCIDKLTDDNNERFPQSLSTALFSFLYHLASYETGGDALVNCGIMQSLIKVVNYYDESQDFIMVKKKRFSLNKILFFVSIVCYSCCTCY